MSAPVTEDVAAAADRARRWVDVAGWTAIALGLAFTAVNVQTFAAAGAPVGSLAWSAAWLLDPMVSVLLLAVVRAEQVTARWQVTMPWPVTATKWATFAATYAMNTWAAWRDVVPSGVVLHSVPPLVVLLGAEVAPVLRERLTEAVNAAARGTVSIASYQAASSALVASEPASPSPAPAAAEPMPDELVATLEELEPVASASLAASEAAPTPPAPVTAPGPVEEPEPDEEPDDGLDPRVREIAELLAADAEVTGPQVAVIHGVSERTGRRLLADARAHLDATSTGYGLRLVDTTTTEGQSA